MRLKPWQITVLALLFVIAAVLLYRESRIDAGQRAFQNLGCGSCHLAGGAPSLARVGRKYDRATLQTWIADPELIYQRRGHQPLNPGYGTMIRQPATPSEVVDLAWFLSAQR